MPTNFTVVPVEDAEGGSKSTAAAGSSKPASLGKLFKDGQDEDTSSHTGSVKQNFFFLFFFILKSTTLTEILLQS